MGLPKQELIKEEAYLEETKGVIHKIIEEKEQSVNEYKKDIVKRKKYLYQNLQEITDPEMYVAMNEEDANVLIVNKELVKIAKLYRSLETPYFGKIVFNGEDIYIGLTSVYNDEKSYVYDWRSPIANMYYDFELGEAHFKAPNGVVRGNISLKRQFQIEMGKLKKAFDTSAAIEDELLQDVLSSSSDDKMKSIVATIQKEQNEIIRYKGKNTLIIEGAPGSGKTVVALHRIAYLLYNQKDLTNKNVLIISPNEVFTNYISNVLPELGEENAVTKTYAGLIKEFLPDLELETLDSFINREYKTSRTKSEKENISFKLSSKYKELLDKYIENYKNNLKFTKSIGLNKRMVKSSELNDIFKNTISKLSLEDTINYISEKLCNLFGIDSDKNSKKLKALLKKELKISNNPLELYNDFLRENNLSRVEEDTIPYVDASNMLYLYFEINGYPVRAWIKEVFIDEAQDITPLEFYILKKIFRSSNFTILGDANQSINPYFRYSSFKEIGKIFKNSKYASLLKTYRSSKEIIEYTNKLLGLENVTSIRNSQNEKVILKREVNLKEDLLSDINSLKSKGYKRIAIITKTEEEANLLLNILDGTIVNITDDILKPVVILPAYLSKGLEFDAVISYNRVDNPYTMEEKHLEYVALTRAEHTLIIYNN